MPKNSRATIGAMTFQKRIQRKVDSLSGAEKRLAQYILSDNTSALLTTTGDLARAVGISESTVVRFAQSLGFKGFPDMKRALQKELRSHLRAAERAAMKDWQEGLDEMFGPELVAHPAYPAVIAVTTPLMRGLAVTRSLAAGTTALERSLDAWAAFARQALNLPVS